ncbi:MAG: 23S rRNA (pseudouridine(1915)-N(3))-methyltransferase RlmH [Firmicutes bacterium]|nr:23S rRNA (pseudouridine(1915)-N(3))-methyltransferase RlmH [Bacillota bacterium]
MRVTIVAVGRLREAYLDKGIAEYAKRLRSYCRLNIIEVKDEPFKEGYSSAQQEMVKAREADRIRKVMPPKSYVIGLDVRGQMRSSEELSELISYLGVSGWNQVTFIIGGALGLHSSILNDADLRLSFSPFTFPHQLMRLILLEQIYRCFTIARGEAYHH